MKPELRQFGTLTKGDFERVPVWLACPVADYDQPWYDDTDEETLRPWTGALPVKPSNGMYLVQATGTLADGSSFPGFLTPASGDDLGIIQPHVFVANELFSFWGGMFGVRQEARDKFYRRVGKSADAVFPIRFTVGPGLLEDATAVEVAGFYRRPDFRRVVVER
jgi:hypothetical protein